MSVKLQNRRDDSSTRLKHSFAAHLRRGAATFTVLWLFVRKNRPPGMAKASLSGARPRDLELLIPAIRSAGNAVLGINRNVPRIFDSGQDSSWNVDSWREDSSGIE